MSDLLADLGALAAVVTVAGFLISVVALAVSAFRFVHGWRQEQQQRRFETYHRILRHVSTGHDETGLMKLINQVAYIHELTRFREYDRVTFRTLSYLHADWKTKGTKAELLAEIERALRKIARRRRIAMRWFPEDFQAHSGANNAMEQSRAGGS